MTRVVCNATECIWNEEHECQKDCIGMSGTFFKDAPATCDDYESGEEES